ncbi:MAG: S9 family peptidase [Oscillochloris sp.]|nr:S9 family peptidase [Oscillochloris sp.]
MARIESLLAARLFLAPQVVGDRIYFVGNLSGRLSLYAMDYGGSVPEPLLPPEIALQNPELIGGYLYRVLPTLDKIMVMLDRDGDENYLPMLIPINGGYPEPIFADTFANTRVAAHLCDAETATVYFLAESRAEALNTAYRANLASGELTLLRQTRWGSGIAAARSDQRRLVIGEGYSMGDIVTFDWQEDAAAPRLLYGTPIEQREPGRDYPASGLGATAFTADGCGLVVNSALFSDTFSLGYLDLEAETPEIVPVTIAGERHSGIGELTGLAHLRDDRFQVEYNIDGCAWAYEAQFDQATHTMRLVHVLWGAGRLAGGVTEGTFYDTQADRWVISFTTATSPTQIYTIEGAERTAVRQHTRERVLGLDESLLAPGEDASFVSYDGLRVSARLYMPAPALGFAGPRPLVYYIHGGPQGQERPNFAWFSMPLIQLLTLRGFAVFVPNVRGSTGYGFSYVKQVDRDWGGQDRLDHVHAMTQVLPNDLRIDTTRAAVVGRSYGGYMTLTLAARHPELWSAAVDMFGPYDLLTFIDRLPETWKPYFAVAVGDATTEAGRAFLVERSPATYIEQITCPLLVIQGRNDPRVVEQESRDVVERLQAVGKPAELLVFENEGHDVLKFENRVRCYNAIAEFFAAYLKP